MSWSTGKDCAWALHALRRQGEVDVVGLLTTLNTRRGRVSMHAVREALLDAQATAVGLPVTKIWIPEPCSNAEYEAAMARAVRAAVDAGITAVAFGDLFLEDVRRYREEAMAPTGVTPLFPLWGLDTAALAHEMLAAGVSARVTCIDTRQLPARFAGRAFDRTLLDELPDGVDPCGERGEFHTFACAGPMFDRELPARVGGSVTRGQFVFSDVTL